MRRRSPREEPFPFLLYSRWPSLLPLPPYGLLTTVPWLLLHLVLARRRRFMVPMCRFHSTSTTTTTRSQLFYFLFCCWCGATLPGRAVRAALSLGHAVCESGVNLRCRLASRSSSVHCAVAVAVAVAAYCCSRAHRERWLITTLVCSLSSAVVPSVVDVTVVTPDESQVTLKVCSPLRPALAFSHTRSSANT